MYFAIWKLFRISISLEIIQMWFRLKWAAQWKLEFRHICQYLLGKLYPIFLSLFLSLLLSLSLSFSISLFLSSKLSLKVGIGHESKWCENKQVFPTQLWKSLVSWSISYWRAQILFHSNFLQRFFIHCSRKCYILQ